MAKKKKTKRTNRGTDGPEEMLQGLKKGWEDTVSRTGSAQFPPGRDREGLLENVVIEVSQNGNLQVVWTIKGTSENIENLTDRKYSQMSTQENREWLRGEMETIGLDWPDDPEELGDSLGEGVGLAIGFDVVDRQEFHNIYFREALEDGESRGGEKEKGASEEDYTKKGIRAMDEDELTELAKESDLDPDDYDTWEDLADDLIELLV